MGALSRRKGAAYERVITRIFRCIYGDSVKRGIGQERAGSEIADVTGVPEFWIQTKHGNYVSIRDALIQAETELAASGKAGMWPLAVVRFQGERDTVTMRLDDFVHLAAGREYALQIVRDASPAYGLLARWTHQMQTFIERLRKGSTDGN